ncbi:hypothetical protein FDH27_gp061 [Vibrio phage SSP002]|uniref:Uncharacterized protein n=1 Tax=Vibrio phage SSP002 TaxID=1161928 RepID=H9EB61_9CAUD|nr:hypothetical protein FDH27_gp061 [Vibrio phage SSP002]AFE86388.1 hypothetical protein SSP002_061 [Vibrio phage SSP002]
MVMLRKRVVHERTKGGRLRAKIVREPVTHSKPQPRKRKKRNLKDSEHSQLCLLAKKWILKNGFGVAIDDRMKAACDTGEQPDAMGWNASVSIVIEVKTSRSDFLADKNKKFRANPRLGMGDWRFYLCPKGLISKDEVPEGWGLLYYHEGKIRRVHGGPKSNGWSFDGIPFVGNKDCEMSYMYSALRRMVVRGHLESMYSMDGIKK